jgi:hypothetical protein
MSIIKLQSSVTTALQHAKGYADAIADATKAAKGMPREGVRTAIMPTVAAFYGVKLKDGEGKAEGTKVLDSEAAKYEAARKALQRLLKDILGTESNGHQEEIEIPEEILKAAERLAKLCAQYEQARKLASTAVAQAFAK